jgi:hypothetical protein
MTEKLHFWLRIVGVGVILALEFGPRAWTACTMTAPTASVAAVTNAR